MKNHGGKRKGAGRTEEISLMTQMSLTLRVAELMRSRGIRSISSAMRILEMKGELPKQVKNQNTQQNASQRYKSYLKYLTPKLLDPRIRKTLMHSSRDGIISLIPKEIPKFTPKNIKKYRTK